MNLLGPKQAGTLQLQVTNLSPKDKAFLLGVVEMFCDPHQNLNAAAVREGLAYLACGRDGKVQLVHRLDTLQRN